MDARGWREADFICVTGDAYVDHPSFGIAVISRLLESLGYRVAVLAQPDCRDDRDFIRLGKPRFGFFVTSGNVDSMVSNYTVALKKRSKDVYSPGGKPGKRPDRALSVYCRKLKTLFPDTPVIAGGLEASLRRFAHYDYWSNCVKPSVLMECKADLLVYGMGESQTTEIAARLHAGENIRDIGDIRGTCILIASTDTPFGGRECPSYENVRSNKAEYARACRIQHENQDAVSGLMLKQRHSNMTLIQNPPALPLTTAQMDEVYALPFMRACHPNYDAEGGVPAFEEVRFSITHNRGCFGDCNFCSLTFHQGKRISSRSKQSVLDEAARIMRMPGFKGYIHDVGGPTANLRHDACVRQAQKGACSDKRCLAPSPCPNLSVSHAEYLDILRSLRSMPGIKKVFIRSGVRYDYLLLDEDESFLRELAEHHVSGQLKVAPEHCSPAVLELMGKPPIEVYDRFVQRFEAVSQSAGKEQYLVAYFISSHPGSTLADAVQLALYNKNKHIKPQQVQDFYPTPGTISTCMYYSGFNPLTMKAVYCAVHPHEKALQRALLQYFLPQNRALAAEALVKAGRRDLIGRGKKCLVDAGAASRFRPEDRRKKAVPPKKRSASKR